MSKKELRKVHYLISLDEGAGEVTIGESGTENGRGWRTLDTVAPTASNLRARISVGGYVFIDDREKSIGANGGRYICRQSDQNHSEREKPDHLGEQRVSREAPNQFLGSSVHLPRLACPL